MPLDENADLPDETYNEEREKCMQNLEHAISYLPEQDQQIIQWHYYEGVPLQTIADRLNQTENNIKVRLFRIRERLKKKIEYEKITDNELDLLLQQSTQHHKAVEQINRHIMRTACVGLCG